MSTEIRRVALITCGQAPTQVGKIASIHNVSTQDLVSEQSTSSQGSHGHQVGMGTLALGALGIVYGDIGTSPIYAFREAFHHQHLDAANPVYALGVASVVFWALLLIISVKYLLFVMRADNHGEGGILALTAMIMPKGSASKKLSFAVALGIFGTALLYGDGLITPAISVLSAVEGVKETTTAFDSLIIPIAVLILAVLFLIQKRGTAGIGRVFGPIMVLWFATLAGLGLNQIIQRPSVLKAISPTYAYDFLWFRR